MLISNPSNLIGNTPMLRLEGVEKAYGLTAQLYAKLEMYNPAGSVKDRAALYMLEGAEKSGLLSKGGIVVEATSGNTGIGLAYACALKGYRFVAVMPETASIERRKLMKAYGAEVILTDGAGGMAAAIQKAQEIKVERNAYHPDQFSNSANALAHYETTGVEIYRDLPDADVFVAGIGSGGTISGTGRYLKEKNPAVKVVGIEPSNSPFLTQGRSGSHRIQGIGAGFLPKTLDKTVLDEVLCVEDADAYKCAKEVAKLDGVFVGISSGAALCGAITLAKREENKGKKLVVIFPDGGERYLSTDLIEN
jgi:cysteine synthase A